MALQDWIMGWDTAGPPASSDALCRGQADIRRGRAFRLSRHGHKGLDEFIATGSIIHSGSWGLWHELGHNHQSPPFTMEGQTEVSVNIFSMVCEVMGTEKTLNPAGAAVWGRPA